jgi:hypothetical protein
MVSGTADSVIRQRQSFEAMRAGDVLPPWLGPLLPGPDRSAAAAKPASQAPEAPRGRFFLPAERTGGPEGASGRGFWRFWFGR